MLCEQMYAHLTSKASDMTMIIPLPGYRGDCWLQENLYWVFKHVQEQHTYWELIRVQLNISTYVNVCKSRSNCF